MLVGLILYLFFVLWSCSWIQLTLKTVILWRSWEVLSTWDFCASFKRSWTILRKFGFYFLPSFFFLVNCLCHWNYLWSVFCELTFLVLASGLVQFARRKMWDILFWWWLHWPDKWGFFLTFFNLILFAMAANFPHFQLLGGLDAMHHLNFVHSDLKPNNVMLPLWVLSFPSFCLFVLFFLIWFSSLKFSPIQWRTLISSATIPSIQFFETHNASSPTFPLFFFAFSFFFSTCMLKAVSFLLIFIPKISSKSFKINEPSSPLFPPLHTFNWQHLIYDFSLS